MKDLLNKINERSACITIIGGGYVGLPLALECVKSGFETIIYDVDARKIDNINNNTSYIDDVKNGDLVNAKPKLSATCDPELAMKDADIYIICVPTPLNKTKDPDISMVVSAGETIRDNFSSEMKDRLVILESTVYPGFTREILFPIFEGESNGIIHLAFSPERVDPGNNKFNTHNTPKVLGGIDTDSLTIAKAFYDTIIPNIIPVSSCDAAEMAKVVENTFRMVNIALANETALECKKLGLNIWEVMEAAATKPFGFMPFWPGPGVGGHCIGLDPHYLAWKLRSLNYRPRFIELAEQINSAMPEYVVHMVVEALSRISHKSITGSNILVLGTTYKANISDLRESPAIDVIHLLYDCGANVKFFDPYVNSIKMGEKLGTIEVEKDFVKAINETDCAVIITNHSNIDYRFVCSNAPIVVDTRNATKDVRIEFPNKVVLL